MGEIAFGTLTWYDLLAQGVGFVATAFMFISFQQRTTKGIILFQIISTSLFALHFFLLGAYSGCVANVLGVVRNLIFVHRGKPWADKRFWLYGFCAAFVVSGILTWQNLSSILPIIGMILGTVALYSTVPFRTRCISLGCSASWLTYNVISRSVPGALTETLAICSIIIAMFKYDRKKNA